jgi:hypothetical protein
VLALLFTLLIVMTGFFDSECSASLKVSSCSSQAGAATTLTAHGVQTRCTPSDACKPFSCIRLGEQALHTLFMQMRQ